MRKIAIYPGTFDPLTNGHFDILYRSIEIFDEVIVAVAKNTSKSPLFTLKARCEILELCLKDLARVRVQAFDTLLADFAKKEGASVILRGLRAVSDFEYELQMGYANQSLNPKLETLYLMPTLQNAFVSSSIVRNILSYGGKISHLVPRGVVEYLKAKGYKCM
ncbi:pantetheine-phosphate adenylyltransferase [Helicobacter cholecystus]|uniref:Phosphopantetheine adenylyltransferase n=1 Tax=Helicobacter cholecystus TaxID=45498 RepID=A0A3D8IYT6_9HELI|nr:pantetheine-phosphate adenylyltransferase [Helicobacter cholecystus]RDU70065.1 pantetheine-phosphate adenylyltransferase [Helicobacter cholecystus]VEJ24764.1 phosphopantetheine adenylyltransferase [Helicobacter cholecystus]